MIQLRDIWLAMVLASILGCIFLVEPVVAEDVFPHENIDQLLTDLRQVVKDQPLNQPVRTRLSEVLLAVGQQYLQDREYNKALEIFAEGESISPENSRFPLYRGVAWFRLGRHDQAEDELKAAIRAGDSSSAPVVLLGQVYYLTGRLYEARQILDETLADHPDDEGVRSLLAKVEQDIQAEQDMTTDYGAHFQIVYDDGVHGVIGRQVLDVLESAYDDLGYLFDYYPETQVNVLLYARQDFLTLTGSPDWSGGLYDGKIRLPVGGVDQMTDRVEAVLYHEYCHVLIRYLTRERCPVWLNEGLAEVAGRMRFDSSLHVLPAALQRNGILSFLPLEQSFTRLADEQVLLAYEQSWSFVDFLLTRFEWFEMNQLLRKISEGMTATDAIGAVYGKYGFDFDTLVREWLRAITN